MDSEEARFVLQSFRPDGADAGDEDFSEALRMAAEDRTLGAWLTGERTADSAFSQALNSIAAPGGLRERILTSATTGFGGVPQADSQLDAKMIGAMATLQAPPALRGQILASMQQTHSESRSSRAWWKKAAWPVAAAAGIALALFLSVGEETPVDIPLAVVPAGTVPVDVVQATFIRTFESPLFSIDENREDHDKLMQILEKKKLPCPKYLPRGLVGLKGEGCREFVIDDKRGSLVCFDEPTNGRVHLVIFKRSDVCGELPGKEHPAMSQNGPWSVARWTDGHYVFVLLGSRPVDKLADLF